VTTVPRVVEVGVINLAREELPPPRVHDVSEGQKRQLKGEVQGCQMVKFGFQKIPIWYLFKASGWKISIYFMWQLGILKALCYIVWSFGIIYCPLV
jgi:hypothetical protein